MAIALRSLRIVATNGLYLHEATEPQRVRRVWTQLHGTGCLQNPVLATPVAGRWLVLDGHHRAAALRAAERQLVFTIRRQEFAQELLYLCLCGGRIQVDEPTPQFRVLEGNHPAQSPERGLGDCQRHGHGTRRLGAACNKP
jgi:hypothetical protein